MTDKHHIVATASHLVVYDLERGLAPIGEVLRLPYDEAARQLLTYPQMREALDELDRYSTYAPGYAGSPTEQKVRAALSGSQPPAPVQASGKLDELRREYRPSMPEAVLRAWAADVVAAFDSSKLASSQPPAAQGAPGAEVPLGAIHNAGALAQRIEDEYSFACEAGDLRLCTDWQELRRCLAHLTEWADGLPAPAASQGAVPEGRALVPVEPEEYQVRRGSNAVSGLTHAGARAVYDAMVRAASQPPASVPAPTVDGEAIRKAREDGERAGLEVAVEAVGAWKAALQTKTKPADFAPSGWAADRITDHLRSLIASPKGDGAQANGADTIDGEATRLRAALKAIQDVADKESARAESSIRAKPPVRLRQNQLRMALADRIANMAYTALLPSSASPKGEETAPKVPQVRVIVQRPDGSRHTSFCWTADEWRDRNADDLADLQHELTETIGEAFGASSTPQAEG